jgi:hypothetical protein
MGVTYLNCATNHDPDAQHKLNLNFPVKPGNIWPQTLAYRALGQDTTLIALTRASGIRRTRGSLHP